MGSKGAAREQQQQKCPSLFLRFDRKMTHFAWHTNHPRRRRRNNRNTKLERLRRTDELLPTMAAAKMLIYFYINATSTKNRARFEKNKSHSEILSNFSWVNFQWNYMWPQMCFFCVFTANAVCVSGYSLLFSRVCFFLLGGENVVNKLLIAKRAGVSNITVLYLICELFLLVTCLISYKTGAVMRVVRN